MPKFFAACFLLIAFSASFCHAQDKDLLAQIEKISADSKGGVVGVSILNLETGDTLNYNAHSRLVLHSVMKFPIAMTVLHLVDKGKYKLDEKMKLRKKDMVEKLYSPLRDKYPDGTEIALSDLLGYMVSLSDNVACDYLLKKIGGPQVVEDYIKSIGVSGIAVRASEAQMAATWEVQYTNWAKPADMAHLLEIFYKGKALSKTSNDFLMKIMVATTTGPHRIKGLLPADAIVAHKTGTSPTNNAGLSPATNDVGIITLPNGKHLDIAIFVCNSKADETTRDAIIAKIAKAAWDAYGK